MKHFKLFEKKMSTKDIIEILKLTLDNSNIEDAKPRIEQVINMIK